MMVGSSPHTRGALDDSDQYSIDGRIIPAYAGSTAGDERGEGLRGDHPRIRGEHYACTVVTELGEGSSPHTRGAHLKEGQNSGGPRIIPAYAGSTF